QADLKTFAALGVHGLTAVTAITVQNTVEVKETFPIPPDVVGHQIVAVVEDIGVDAAKTGMLYDPETIKVVSQVVSKKGIPLVVDPILASSTGHSLQKNGCLEALREILVPIATVVTPNSIEASFLCGFKIKTLEEAKRAAKAIASLGARAVVVKGGHLEEAKAIDVLYFDGELTLFEGERFPSTTTHGSGCVYSAAITAGLAKGKGIEEAIRMAKDFTTLALRYGLPLGAGSGPVNPMANLFKEAERWQVIRILREALRIIEARPEVASLIPEVQSNLVMATSYAQGLEDVAGIPGRIVRLKDGVRASGDPDFGVSKHVARTVLTARRYDPSVKSGMNIRFSEDILRVCRELGLTESSYDRRLEPESIKIKEGATTQWGTEEAIKKIGKVPDIIYHLGDWGKEPLITVLGKDAKHVAMKVLRIAEGLRSQRSS
ncbi:MAG: bifunctional hydroxymethylpyrimidine kinase/phosphomethylpyrimidine kinase, partial [Candidatus Bathyarchaeia archaeon]